MKRPIDQYVAAARAKHQEGANREKVDRAKRELLLDAERRGSVTVTAPYRTKWQAASELIDDGLVLNARTNRDGPDVLRIQRNPQAIRSDAYNEAIGRTLAQGVEVAAKLYADDGLPLTDAQIGQIAELILDLIGPRLEERIRAELLRPRTEEEFDKDLREVIAGRSGFEMEQVLSWLRMEDDGPARARIGLALRRLGYRRTSITVEHQTRRLYLLPAEYPGGAFDDFVERAAAATVEFGSVTGPEVLNMMGETADAGNIRRIGRAMLKLGWRRRVRGKSRGEREVYYQRSA